jgi:Ca-activated chloride channel family protein
MKRITYRKYTGEDFGIDAEDLMQALSDFFLQSGYQDPYSMWQQFDPNAMEELLRQIQQALESGDLFPDDQRQEMLDRLLRMTPEELNQLLRNLAQKLADEGYINVQTEQVDPGNPEGPGRAEAPSEQQQVRFEVTDKSLDFLGFRALKDLMGAVGKSSLGSHDTREQATGVEASGSSKLYEFGDTLNLDISATLFSAMQREGVKVPLNLEYQDLHVHQSEYQSSCATVIMLDCSHSMILYGEDRFTPAKKVAMALGHLVRTQYPGDSIRCVLFHDSAEELRMEELARVQVGPYHTNTRDGLLLAQKILRQEKKDMKQIIMITDGKPSALTLDDGRIYKNPFGLDPLVISKTLEEVGRCRKQGILINTFMLAQDYALVQFVQKVTEICRGKAYFTTPYTLGQYLLMDYMNRKSRVVH